MLPHKNSSPNFWPIILRLSSTYWPKEKSYNLIAIKVNIYIYFV